MSKFIRREVKDIEISGIRQFNQKASQVEGVIKLTIGELTLDTPEEVKKAAINAINDNRTRYTSNKGLVELRQMVAAKYKGYTSDEVILTVGTTEGLSIVLKSIISEEDEVIIPTPAYVGYAPLVTLEKGKVVEINTLKTSYKITREALLNAYSSSTKALIITSPNNPTGYVLTDEEMDVVKDFVLEKDILLISDEIYASIVYEQSYRSFSEYKELRSNLILLNGFSKSHAMTGFRIGYVVGPINMIDHFVKVHQYNVTSTSTISQYAALKAIEADYEEVLESLLGKRQLVLDTLEELTLSSIPSKGAFYIFYNISRYNMTSLEYCDALLEEYKVALVPGEYFLGNHKDFVRLSYAGDLLELKVALNYIKEFDKAHR